MTAIRFANNQVATEQELDAIARAFGFMSWAEMDRVCRTRDEKRAERERSIA
ncbi:hypothetical protein [Nocardia asiatica]|uniref:hypothetical protein n=1 Tax=Nocardia asiatica TaxID=209252 RepID=UPI0002D32B84|nr:hypothetical protein [Nocardia asiatica]